MGTQRQAHALVGFSSPWRETGRKDALRRRWLMLDRVKVWDRRWEEMETSGFPCF